MPGKEIGRLWGISGGFLDCEPVIIEIKGIEAGCWRGCCMIGRVLGSNCMIGRAFKDQEKPKSVTGKAQTPHKRHLGPVSVITSESTILTSRYP